jgi:hypothetical protein
MAENVGALALPVPAPTGTDSLSDPCLDVVLAAVKAVMNSSTLATAWAAAAPKTTAPVNQAFAGEPDTTNFSAADLPALFLWRIPRAPMARIADDYIVAADSLSLVWCYPRGSRDLQGRLDNVVNGITKVVGLFLTTGRHPAWVAAGDTEPQAAYRGSYLWKHAGLWSMRPGRWSTEPVAIEMSDGSQAPGPYSAVRLMIDIEERHVPDHVAMLAGQATLTIPDGASDLTIDVIALPIPPLPLAAR